MEEFDNYPSLPSSDSQLALPEQVKTSQPLEQEITAAKRIQNIVVMGGSALAGTMIPSVIAGTEPSMPVTILITSAASIIGAIRRS